MPKKQKEKNPEELLTRELAFPCLQLRNSISGQFGLRYNNTIVYGHCQISGYAKKCVLGRRRHESRSDEIAIDRCMPAACRGCNCGQMRRQCIFNRTRLDMAVIQRLRAVALALDWTAAHHSINLDASPQQSARAVNTQTSDARQRVNFSVTPGEQPTEHRTQSTLGPG